MTSGKESQITGTVEVKGIDLEVASITIRVAPSPVALKVKATVEFPLPSLKEILEDVRFWHLIVNYTQFEMMGKELINEYFKNNGITGMDDWVRELTCMSLLNRLHKLKLINKQSHDIIKQLVKMRNVLVHDFSEIMLAKAFDKDEIDNIVKSSRKVLSRFASANELKNIPIPYKLTAGRLWKQK